YIKAISLFRWILIRSGCMFPDEELSKNKIPNEDQLLIVQNAGDEYAENSGEPLSIKTKDASVDIYEKYRIDCSEIRESDSPADIPRSAYENVVIYSYMLVNVEYETKVKLIDLQLSEKIRYINVKLYIYRSKNLYPPYGEEIEKDLFTIDFEKLNYKEEQYVKSPYTQNNLPFIMNTDGEVFIDYRSDFMNIMEENDFTFKENEDIRYIYHEVSP